MSYNNNIKKLFVSKGLGDCLRQLSFLYRAPAYCEHHKTKIYASYEFISSESPKCWELNNAAVIADFLNDVQGISFVDLNVYRELDMGSLAVQAVAPLAYRKFDFISDYSPDAFLKDKINIALQPRGGMHKKSPKQFNLPTVKKIISAFDPDRYAFHMIDVYRDSYLNELETLLGKDYDVHFYNNSFLNNYKLVSLCDGLIAPDSWTKYVLNHDSQDLKKVIVCTSLDYVKSLEQLRKTYFTGIDNERTAILGYSPSGEPVPTLEEICADAVIAAAVELFKDL